MKKDYEYSGSNEFTDGFAQTGFVDSLGKHNSNQLGNTCKEEICFSRAGRERFTQSGTERVFEEVDGALDQNAVTVKIIPMLCTSRDTGIKAEVFGGIGVNTSAVRRISARVIT